MIQEFNWAQGCVKFSIIWVLDLDAKSNTTLAWKVRRTASFIAFYTPIDSTILEGLSLIRLPCPWLSLFHLAHRISRFNSSHLLQGINFVIPFILWPNFFVKVFLICLLDTTWVIFEEVRWSLTFLFVVLLLLLIHFIYWIRYSFYFCIVIGHIDDGAVVAVYQYWLTVSRDVVSWIIHVFHRRILADLSWLLLRILVKQWLNHCPTCFSLVSRHHFWGFSLHRELIVAKTAL